MSNVNLTISPVVAAVTVSPVQPALSISGVTSIPSGPVGGDLAGSLPNPTVDGIRGRAVAATPPTDGQFLRWNDALSQWEPATVTGGSGTVTSITAGTGLTGGTITTSGTIAANFGTSAGTVCEGNDSRLSDSRAPSGAAGGSLSGTYPNPSLASIPTARLLGNSSGVSASPAALAVSSPLGFNGVSGNLEFTAPGSNGQVYYRASDALTTSAFMLWDNATSRFTVTNPTAESVYIDPFRVSANQTLTLQDTSGGNGTYVNIDDSSQNVAFVDFLTVDMATADLTAASVTTDRVTFTTNGEYIRNTVNGRIDFMPAPHPSDDYGVYFDLTSSAFYALVGTIDSAGNLNTNAGFQFQNTLAVVSGKNLDFANTTCIMTGWGASGGNNGVLHVAPFINGTNQSGSVALVSQSGNGSANRRPTTAHTHPTLYIYAAGSANAAHYLRANHDGTNATVESGAGSLNLVSAADINNNGNRIPKVFYGNTAPSSLTGTDGDLYFQHP